MGSFHKSTKKEDITGGPPLLQPNCHWTKTLRNKINKPQNWKTALVLIEEATVCPDWLQINHTGKTNFHSMIYQNEIQKNDIFRK